MACPTVNLLTDLLINADGGGTWTYNGYAASYDGDPDNLAQFVDIPASPPEELGALAGEDPSVDPTGHTVGFYSLTYDLSSGGCTATNNIVLPILETYYAGQDVTKAICSDDTSLFNLFDLISDFGNLSVDTQGTWEQLNGTPNPHPGFTNPVDPQDATFDVSYIDYPNDTFPLQFMYTTREPAAEGFTRSRCIDCAADTSIVSITMTSTTCCPDLGLCYEADIPDLSNIYTFTLNTGILNNADEGMNFPYTLPADNSGLETDLNNYLTNNGGGTATITAGVGVSTILIQNACIGFRSACHNEACSSSTTFELTTCP